MTDASLLFVGESPPVGASTDFVPFDCASGTRLSTIMLGLRDRATLLAHIPRTNIYDTPTGANKPATSMDLPGLELLCAPGFDLYTPPWDPSIAQARGMDVMFHHAQYGTRVVVALGRRTAEALGLPDALRMPSYNWAPPIGATWRARVTDVGDYVTVLYAPHPSGASSALKDATTRTEVRAMLMPELILGVPMLRPWHFRLDDPSILASLSAAVSPLCPALGAATLLYADSMHRATEARASIPLLALMSAATSLQELGEATAEAERASRTPPWDTPMRTIAATLLTPDGGRDLSERWTGDAINTVLRKAAKAHAALNGLQTRSAMRATIARYAAAGLTC